MPVRTPASLAEQRPAAGCLALVGALVFDGLGWIGGRASTVVLDSGRIESVLPGVHLPEQVPSLDLDGRYLVPGLVDAHAHLSILDGSVFPPEPPHGAEPLYPALAGHLVAATLRRTVRADGSGQLENTSSRSRSRPRLAGTSRLVMAATLRRPPRPDCVRAYIHLTGRRA